MGADSGTGWGAKGFLCYNRDPVLFWGSGFVGFCYIIKNMCKQKYFIIMIIFTLTCKMGNLHVMEFDKGASASAFNVIVLMAGRLT